ncbi:glycosyltransferase family 4 protein [Geotalea uraniireducens]|uniref:glycosyltransferase family 4 protein n=1 Tax=Geotalea uraniireducens TaxID=351604 RepID=UPI0018DC985C|nr:glycosyltransferase family 1 protein [Geotalea uraniireducens]
MTDALCGSPFYNTIKLDNELSDDNRFFTVFKAPFPFITVCRFLLFLQAKVTGKSIKIANADIFFGTNFRGVFTGSAKTVLTIHDMAHEYFPDAVDEVNIGYLKNELPQAAKKAHLLIADSENTKKDIMRFLDVPEEKVRVIYLGVDEGFKPLPDPDLQATVRDRYRLPSRFILFVGTVQPRKNLDGLMRAYAQLCARPDFSHTLVIAGGSGWKNEGLKELIRTLGLGEKVHFTGYVDETDLPVIYNLADLFVFPSFYEGFGLPLLEAMACGVPVVSSNASCLPEVAGDSALLVYPHSVEDIAAGIARLLGDEALRRTCIERGRERAKLFTWEKCARETLDVFRTITAG